MKAKNILLAIISAALLSSSLAGCNNKNTTPAVDPKDQPIQPLDHLLPIPDWATPVDELDSFENDTSYHQNVFADVETGYTFTIKMDTTSYSGTLSDYVRVYDSTRIQYSLNFEDLHDGQYRVSPNQPYERGRYYTIEIKDNAPFHMAGKDPTLKEFHFNVVSLGDTEVYNVKDTVHRFLLSDVVSKQEFSSSNDKDKLNIMIVKHSLNLIKGDHFLFWDGNKIDRHAFYGKFDHEVFGYGVYHVYYTYPDLGEVFGEDGLDVNYHNYVPTEIYDLVLASENEIKENLENSPELQEFFYNSYLLYEPEKPHVKMDAYDWVMAMKAVQICPSFGFYWPGWSFSISLRVTIPFDYAKLTFFWQYYRQSTLSADAQIKLRTCAGVPYWADLAVDVSEVIDTTYRFCIIVGDNIPTAESEEDDDKLFQSLDKYAKDSSSSFQNADKKMQTIKDSGKDGVKFDGSSLTIKLGTGRFPIGSIFDFFIDFNFTLRLKATVMLSMSYTEHSQSTIISYRSGDDDKSSHSVSDLKSSSKTLMLIGTLEIDVGLFLRFGIGICGLEDYISFSFNASIGLYVTFGGYGMWSWVSDASGKRFEGLGGLIFEVGWFAKVGVELNLFFVDLSCDFVYVRKPFYSTTANQYFVSPPTIEGNVIHLETHKILVKDLGLLTFDTFNVGSMKVAKQDFDPEVELDYQDDHGDDKHGKVFNFSFKTGKYIRYENGYFIIDDDCPAKFSDVLYVDVPKSLYELKDGKNHFIEVDIDFYDIQARPIYFDDDCLGYARYGDKVQIPGCPEDREGEGYRFYGWYCEETKAYYGEGEYIVVPLKDGDHTPLVLTSYYYPIVYHTVTFYDGLGNVIWTGQVEEGTDAPEPSADKRDELMPDDAVFIGWSTDFTNVFYDTDVYAIYYYIGGGNNQYEKEIISSILITSFLTWQL